jgi:hypothetical protein
MFGRGFNSLDLNHIDCFVSQSRGNISVEQVILDPYASNAHGDDAWEKVGQAIANLQALGRIHIHIDRGDEHEDPPNPDWHVRQRITLTVAHFTDLRAEDFRSFALAIHGYPSIRIFVCLGMFPFESMNTLYSALATLPALESIVISNRGVDTRLEDESALANPESLTELLRLPNLRFVCFDCFFLTPALFQATANASPTTKVKFRDCSFSTDTYAAIMPSGLGRNTSVRCIRFEVRGVAAFYRVLTTALPSNSTLQERFLLKFLGLTTTLLQT